jgi:opacity protein-like surface antigen
LVLGLIGTALTVVVATDVRAQGFVSPFIGYDFSGDSGCPQLTGCEDKKLNAGVSFGAMGNVLGFEEEFAYANNFFGTAPGLDSSVLTLMSNAMFVPKIGPVRPYALAGVGLIKTHVEFTPSSVLTSDNNNVGWDVGGGLMLFFSGHVGLRGDVRHLHSFQNLNVLGFTLSDNKLDFGRASAALVLKF